MDAMSKMWMSLIGIGLMAIAAVIITVARTRTKGVVKGLLSGVAFIFLCIGFLLGLLSII